MHRYEKGYRLRFVIAASDDAYFGNREITRRLTRGHLFTVRDGGFGLTLEV